ncbi:DNA-binding protein [Glutamicibacter uratoxydans]|uniref:DNA-binding protein n=1 Tax=Glutamicibacter uratoxydans TaxID=43667 RepID=A0A4Y4DRZ7_GLUUR|nr:DNA-binding protein [Glutamicibacter uratoxydans]GED07397.1 DNA-binding protein [Glutamicibacter uratoxydans]
MEETLAQQRAMYGSTLAERFGAMMEHYDLSQRSLASVLGISAPMLSQLISGRRIKIGNPAVYGRLLMLEGRVQEPDLQQVLEQVSQADPVTATHSVSGPRSAAVDYLRQLADARQLREAGRQAGESAPALAALLLEAAGD